VPVPVRATVARAAGLLDPAQIESSFGFFGGQCTVTHVPSWQYRAVGAAA
jgi:hypothetical protein